MERMNKFLEDFIRTESYFTWAQFYAKETSRKKKHAFARLCRDLRLLDEALERALNTVGELGLDKGGWTMGFSTKEGPELLRTSKKGRERSGAGEKLDWGRIALQLSLYFRARIRRPCNEKIARLLYFAGYEDLYGVLPAAKQPENDEARDVRQEIGRIRRRVKELEKDDAVMYGVCACLEDYELAYDRRPPATFGDMPKLIESVFGRRGK